MEVDTVDLALDLVEAYIVETLEAGPMDGSDAMVRDEEVLFPSHPYILLLSNVRYRNGAFSSLLLIRSPWRELGPMTQIYFRSCTPVLMLRKEVILRTDYFALEVCGESRMILGET